MSSFCYLCDWWHHFRHNIFYIFALLPFTLYEQFIKMSPCLKLTHYPQCWWYQWLDVVSILIPGTYSPFKVGPELFLENIRRKHRTSNRHWSPLLLLSHNNLWPHFSELKIGVWTTKGLCGNANTLSFESSILEVVANIPIPLLSEVPTVPPRRSPHCRTPACVIG